MNKIDLVNTYYQAWINEDIESFKNVLLVEKFGIRNFFKDIIFGIDDLKSELRKFELLQFKVSNIEENNNVLYCDLAIDYNYKNTRLCAQAIVKFVFKNDKIVRVYETLNNSKYTRIKCIVSYDGSVFSGLQRQPELKTVQGDIEKGLKFLTTEDITIHSSGRTDKGVHALNQVFHFDTLSKIIPENFWRVLNNYLPDSIYIKSSKKVQKTFHSRYDVLSKEYVYIINHKEYDPIKRHYEWYIQGLDIDLIARELEKIRGIHDFTSFTKANEEKEMVREILDVKLKKTDTHLYISIIGRGFLRYMVRNLVATFVEIALGRSNLSISDYIDMKDPSEIKWKAPSSGLYLKEVIYYE